MVLSIRSQIRQVTERFIHQSGLFKIFNDTRYGMDRFFSFRFKIQLYLTKLNQIDNASIQFYWRLAVTEMTDYLWE